MSCNPNLWLQQEEEPHVIPTTLPHEVLGASGEFSGGSGISGVSGEIEPSGDSSVSETSETSVSTSGDIDDPDVILFPDEADEGQYLP